MTILTIISLVVLIIISVALFFRFAPQIGGNPEGERLMKMQESVNYSDGKFVNTIDTKMDMSFRDMASTLYQVAKGDPARNPAEIIESKPFSKNGFKEVGDTGITFTWFGHSSVIVRIESKNILIDPVFSDRASMFSFMGPKRYNYANYMSVDQLPQIDLILISHDHYDHLDYETMKKLVDVAPKVYTPLGVGAHLEEWGFESDQIIELDWWDSVNVSQDLQLILTPSRHFSGRGMTDRFNTLWGSWVVKGRQKNMFFGGDSGYFPGFKEIGERYGPFDITMLECGQYNKKWHEIHMMPEETVQAHLDLKGDILMPIHWGKFTLALHPWKESVIRAKKAADQMNVQLFTPEVGQIVHIPEEVHLNYWWESIR